MKSSRFLSELQKNIISNDDEVPMDTDQLHSTVMSTGREGGYKRGKAHAQAHKKLNSLKKHKK